jgi:hypothetical protein
MFDWNITGVQIAYGWYQLEAKEDASARVSY